MRRGGFPRHEPEGSEISSTSEEEENLPKFQFVNTKEVVRCKWDPHYQESATWHDKWAATKDSNLEWPVGYNVQNGKLYFGQKLCVP